MSHLILPITVNSHFQVLPLQREMKNKNLFGIHFGVLNVGTFIIYLVLFVVGFLSFFKYGVELKDSVTANLPEDNM